MNKKQKSINPKTESLLFPSTIRMYGRPFAGLKIDDRGASKDVNNDLHRQLAETDVQLARIYGFVYEGSYYDLPAPCIFVVRGEGLGSTDDDFELGIPTDLILPKDFRMWAHEKSDMTIRIDTEAGSFEETMLSLLRAGAGLKSGYAGGVAVAGYAGGTAVAGYGMKATSHRHD